MVDPERVRRLLVVLRATMALLDADVAARLRGLTGLRNLIVHLYAEVDDDRVSAAVDDGLGDVDRFAQTIAELATGS